MRLPLGACLALAGAVVLAILLAGCGGGSNTTVIERTVTEATPPPGATTEGAPPAGSTQTQPPVESTTPAGSEAPTRFVHLTEFRSPSGNIGCMIFSGGVRCDIARRSWSPPPRPASCPSQVDFGQGLEVGSGGHGTFVCAGDTARNPSAARLPYGTATSAAGIDCVSRASGITCTNAGGHGFFISIQSYRTF